MNTSSEKSTINLQLRKIRISKKIKAEKLSAVLGVSFQHYYSLERMERHLSAEQLAILAKVLEVSMDELFGQQRPVDFLSELSPSEREKLRFIAEIIFPHHYSK